MNSKEDLEGHHQLIFDKKQSHESKNNSFEFQNNDNQVDLGLRNQVVSSKNLMYSAKKFEESVNNEKKSRTCSNCGTSSTSTWRNLGDLLVCNACKCFYRKHGRNRPLHMRKDTIISRHRKPCKLKTPNESVFRITSDNRQNLEMDPLLLAEAVCKLMQSLKNM
jgi:hypothetical protein